jgi:predicted protein tyrosine phosphatase
MTKKLNYLFVCLANQQRSPTAEAVCKRIAKEEGLDMEISSAGISKNSNRPLTRAMADEADKVFVMEYGMKMELQKLYGQEANKIICLNIPDEYDRHDPWLVKILEDKLYQHFSKVGMLSNDT